MIVGVFMLFDVIVCGIMFEFLFKEWVVSFVFLFIIILYYCIRVVVFGMFLLRIDIEEEL